MFQTNHSNLSMVLLGALLFSVAPITSAQSLGDVARQFRKEREERKKKGEIPVKVFTNDDIAKMPPIAILKSTLREPSSAETEPTVPPQPSGAANAGTQKGAAAATPGKSKNGKQSKEYWQARFKEARARLAHAKEEKTLVEDELRLLQIQQARELNPDRSRRLNGQIDASTIELESKRAATEKAQRALEQLEKEFKESGAPQDWIQEGTKPE